MIASAFCVACCLFAFGTTAYSAHYVIFGICLRGDDGRKEGQVILTQQHAGR
jgi:hypothetical protein